MVWSGHCSRSGTSSRFALGPISTANESIKSGYREWQRVYGALKVLFFLKIALELMLIYLHYTRSGNVLDDLGEL